MKRIPKDIAQLCGLETLLLDEKHINYPDPEIVSKGTEAIMRFLCTGISFPHNILLNNNDGHVYKYIKVLNITVTNANKQTPAEDISEGGNDDKNVVAKIIEPEDEITLETLDSGELCEKLFVIPRHKVDNHNIGIEYDVKEKLDKKGIKVKKLVVERMGGTWKGDFTRCEVNIEPFSVQAVEKFDFEILNCCVLPYT